MATTSTLEYEVVTGTIAAIGTFNAAVAAKTEQGFSPAVVAQTDGTNIWQLMIKGAPQSFTLAWAITAAPTVGVAGAGSFTIAGDVRAYFSVGFRFTVTGSSGNDGIYTVRSEPTFAGGNTSIPVKEAVTDATADGKVIRYAP